MAKFRAAGGRRFYVVISLSDISEPFIVVPIEKGVDGAALAAVFEENGPEHAEVVGGAVVYSSGKSFEGLKRARPPKPRPDLPEVMAAAGTEPVRVVLIPTDDVRKALEEVMPELPKEIGGGSAGVLSQGVRWATLSIKPPPEPALRLVIQAKDANGAEVLMKLYEKGVEQVKEQVRATPVEGMDHLVALLASVRPKVEGNRLTLTLDSANMSELAVGLILPSMLKARESGKMLTSSFHIRQLLKACMSYANDNDNKWPDTLAQLAKYVGGEKELAELMAVPKRGSNVLKYVYRKPKPKEDNYEFVVIYEVSDSNKKPERFNVGFLDTHVETLSREELKKRLVVEEKK